MKAIQSEINIKNVHKLMDETTEAKAYRYVSLHSLIFPLASFEKTSP